MLLDKQRATMTKFGYPSTVLSREPTRYMGLNREATKIIALNREATKYNNLGNTDKVKPIINNRYVLFQLILSINLHFSKQALNPGIKPHKWVISFTSKFVEHPSSQDRVTLGGVIYLKTKGPLTVVMGITVYRCL